MRRQLAKLGSDQRYTFEATYGGVGFKNAYRNHYMPTLVLTNIMMNGKYVTNHAWFTYGKQFSDFGMLQKGDHFSFTGRVKAYYKGKYPNQTLDYQISNPRSVKLINHNDATIICRPLMPTIPTEKNAMIGYVMVTNKDFYLSHGRPYDKWYVKKYQKWHESLITDLRVKQIRK